VGQLTGTWRIVAEHERETPEAPSDLDREGLGGQAKGDAGRGLSGVIVRVVAEEFAALR
jgi:hypothetical protein